MSCYNVFPLFIPFLFINFILAADLHNIHLSEIFNLHNMTIDEYVNHINPPAVHKFQNANGQTVLCVKYEDQIALRSGHINKDSNHKSTYKKSSMKVCPEGSVPILKITRESVESFGSVRNFLTRRSTVHTDAHVLDDVDDKIQRQWAKVQIKGKKNEDIIQSTAAFNAWQSFVGAADDYSLTSMWLSKRKDGVFREFMEAGLQVYPKRYKSTRLTFYIHYKINGLECYDVECEAFVQEGQFYPGMPITNVSVYDGPQRESLISIKKETKSGISGWALYFQNEYVGYWLASYFLDLAFSVAQVDFGGDVAVAKNTPGNVFPKTDMGSGHFSNGRFKKAAYIKNIQLYDASGNIISGRKRKFQATKPTCYDIERFVTNDGDFIYFGGPGGDVPQCKN